MTIATTRIQRRLLAKENAKRPEFLLTIPRAEWPASVRSDKLTSVLRSRDYLCQVYDEGNEITRLSFSRTTLNPFGRWEDNITWDDLMRLKAEAGYGLQWAVEVFPSDFETVNVANMRHLWVLPEAPAFAWRAA